MGQSGPTPYLRDHRPRAFSVGALGVGDDAAWVADAHYPLMVRLDPGSGEIEGPFELNHAGVREGGKDRSIRDLAVGPDAVWCLQAGGLMRHSPESGAQTRFPVEGNEMAVGPDAIFVADRIWSPRGEIVSATGTVIRRLDASAGEITEFELPGRLLARMALGDGALWAATYPPGEASGMTLSRIDPGSGTIEGELALPGMVRQLWADEAAVWVLATALLRSGVEWHLLGLDPDPLRVRSDVESPPVFDGALHRGELWAYPEVTESSSTLARLDPSTGRSLGDIRLARPARAIESGGAGVWVDQISTVAELGAQGPISEFQLRGLPIPDHLLPPSRPEIRAEEWELRAREDLAAVLAVHAKQEPRSPRGSGRSRYEHVEFVSARLLGSFPTTRLAVLFRAEEHPDHLFGHQWPLWEPDGAAVSHPLDGLLVDLMENLERRAGPILDPEATPDEDGVVWI